MKHLLLLSLAGLLLGACAHKHHASTRAMTVRTTAYTAAEPGGARNACGERLHFGGKDGTYSAAADWSFLPLGTKFKMKETGRTYVIEDYGSALVGTKTIDLFMPSNAAMREWGVRHVNIEILEMGSKAMSLKLLEPRKAPYVQRMVASLKGAPESKPQRAEAKIPERRLLARD